MKKRIALLIACMLTLGAGSAFAEAGNGTPAAGSRIAAAVSAGHIRSGALLQQFQDELHKIDALRVERLDLKSQIVQKRDKLIDLTLAARKSGDKAALQKAAGIRKQITALNGTIKPLLSQMKNERKQLREAVKARDKQAAKSAFDHILATFGQINDKLKEKSGLYDQMIAALTPAE
ncbi:hypothetical protein [Paenibacillus humicola]|uniref:hypothetical protein n=1 Tax=Paenibacillus humicola TaxID=3110540 RepID=UPI00237A8254|nr:hypothetical protein [Paenibacillus humicola]